MDRELAEELCRELLEIIGDWAKELDVGQVQLVSPGSGVPDATAQVLLQDSGGRSAGFVLCSSPPAPEMVTRGVNGASAAKEVLGAELGKVILEPLLVSRWRGLSCVLLPYCAPVDAKINRLGRWRLSHPMLDWLHGITRHTQALPTESDRRKQFEQPLQFLLESEDLARIVGGEVDEALGRLQNGTWQPRQVLMHGDLHLGNVLLSPPSQGKGSAWQDRLVVIDWGGCDLKGQAIYDLVRLAKSLMLSKRRIRKELLRYAETLSCEMSDLRSYLLAALGQLGMNLDQFPRSRYLQVVESCMAVLPARL